MANRLEQIRRIKQGVGFASKHITDSDWHGAIVVQNALIEQLLALIEGEDLNDVSDPDVVITFKEDCGDDSDT
jgi:hypothetical protein|tara:strand:+ start:674 stop:892 length:219 start_codon:yes stop_codon:yes gene_type:complete